MKPLQKDLNAVVVIAAREVLRFFKDWKTSLVFSFMFPVLFLGILGGVIAQNLGGGLGYNYLQFALLGMVAATISMNTMLSVTSLVEDRENDFTQEIFVAPISRYSIIFGKIVGGSITSILQLFVFVVIAPIMGISIGVSAIGWILVLAPLICISGGTLGVLVASIFSSSPKTADKGVIKLEGQEVKPTDPRIAQELGLAIVHQELAFCLNMTVAENLMLGTMRPTPDSLTGPNCGTGRKRCSTRLDPISTRIPLWRDALKLCSRAKGRGR